MQEPGKGDWGDGANSHIAEYAVAILGLVTIMALLSILLHN